MAQINKPSDHLNTILYTGDGASSKSITGVGFEHKLIWIKERTSTSYNQLIDSVRGFERRLQTNTTDAEDVDTSPFNDLKSIDSDGWTMGNGGGVNENGQDYVAWNFKANGTGTSNSDGSITSTVSANTTSGFSIVSYTGTGANATVGHGLGVAPSLIINKCRSAAQNWATYHSSLGGTKALFLDGTSAAATSSSYFNNTDPTSSVFSVGNSGDTNKSAQTQISYCFAEKKGFSKFGKFNSNNSDDGTFTYCGFKPAWIMMKANVTDAWSHWFIFDNKRDTYNLADLPQYANLAIQDGYYGGTPATNYSQIDMLSNGFKMRRDGNWGLGGSGTEVIYMAFAEQPLVGTNDIPATAR
jgi:hypothetical protein